MTNPNHNWDEQRLAELLRSAQHPAVPPDERFLARLRAESTAAFRSSNPNPTRERGTGEPTPAARKSKMFIYVWRTLAAAAAAVVLTVSWFATTSSGGDTATLATVLAKTVSAKSLHLRIAHADRHTATEAWSAKADELRVNHADGTYDIARKDKLWRIDVKANRAASGESPYYRAANKSLDLLPLLGLDSSKARDSLLAATARPLAESVGGKRYDVYRYQITDVGRPLLVEARVDQATQFLYSLETLVDRDGKTTPAITLTVLDANQPVNEDLFVVGDTLTEDGRIGKVSDVQGMVSIKPVMAERWTPVCGNILLRPGDWLRTDIRGANAVAARLAGKAEVVAGPGALVELDGPKKVRLYEGEIQLLVPPARGAGVSPAEVAAGTAAPQIELLGPGEEKMTVKSTGVYRIQNDRLALAKEDPKWLKGFLGKETQESIGSLVANVDGRNVPLTVGYHKVTVEIRDQIARTTVEESFVNMTDSPVPLEGVFYFPLPQDASISGFGMWIGNELVEADIVEKQRAREIYEIIRSEHRDPGLLEWQGGNLFSARVYPIPAHAEKRIHIIYTQVLPRTGNTFRYSYALQSEMLKQHPLRELSIDVKLNSVVPLKKVSCPTHTVRTAQTEHSAHVEFAAQEYTPTRDFEVVAELEGKQSELTLIPHRRGDDGYFMLLLALPEDYDQDISPVPLQSLEKLGTLPLTSPKEDVAKIRQIIDNPNDRDLLVDKESLDLILLADTSASMDAGQRKQQAEFIAAVLASLTPRDTVNLACCDVDCDWAFEKGVSAEPKNITTIRQFLDRRASLGWTDLAKAFAQVFERAGRNTCIVYVGDGIPTVGRADPAAVAAQLRRIYDEKCHDKKLVCHAVSVGSMFESGVLKAIGSLGGGSMRQVTGEQGPRVVALDLLKEMTRPGLRDLKVQFDGLRVARVYPEQLPNLPGGSQQIILGRYLPQGKEQSGKVIVTGKQGDQDVRYEKAVSLADAEQGNSFIPRLWARMDLDYLLQQGATPTIKDDIIGLSEEYHIITPYTSLLVLESDADRERFKVKRSFTMRDGEKFFHEGLANADFELKQQQMKRAGNWRIGLRMGVLRQFSTLGRNPGAFQPVNQWGWDRRAGWGGGGGIGGGFSSLGRDLSLSGLSTYSGGTVINNGAFSFGLPGLGVNKSALVTFDQLAVESAPIDSPESVRARELLNVAGKDDAELLGRSEKTADSLAEDSDEKLAYADRKDIDGGESLQDSFEDLPALRPAALQHDRRGGLSGGQAMSSQYSTRRGPRDFFANFENTRGRYIYGADGTNGEVENWLNSLFGSLLPAPAGAERPAARPDWPAEALAISKNLLRSDQFAQEDGGLRIDLLQDYLNPISGEVTSHFDYRVLSSAGSWLVRAASDGGQTTVHWCDGKEQEIFNRSFQLGRARKAVAAELNSPPINFDGYIHASLEFSLSGFKVTIRHPADGQTLLNFQSRDDGKNECRVLVDTKRNVVLSIENRYQGKTTTTQQFSDFVEVAGAWWATTTKTLDEKGRATNITSRKFARLDDEQYSQAMAKERSGRELVQFLRDPAETVLAAKKALASGTASFDDQVTLLMHFARSGQWARAMEHLAAVEKLADGKPGVRWLRYAVLKSARRNEELKGLFLQEAGKLTDTTPDNLYLAGYLLGQANGILEANEMLTLLDSLRPVYEHQPAHLHAPRSWKQQRAGYLANAGRGGEATTIYKELAEASPRDFGVQFNYLQNLQNSQEYEAERKWIDRVLSSDAPWQPDEINQLRSCYTQSLRAEERYEELAAYLARWIEQNPESADPYNQYLDALYYIDRADEANALMDRWFRDGRRDDVAPPATARLQGAMNWIFNQCQTNYSYYGGYHIDQRWQNQLIETAVFFCRHKTRFSIAEQIINDWRFQQTEGNQKARAALAKVFAENVDRLTLEEIGRFINWLRGNDSLVTKPQWKEHSRRLQLRYSAEPNEELKNRLAQTVANILSFAADADEYMAYLRQLSHEAPQKYRPYYVSQLFQTLLSQPWSEKYESEALDLLGQLGGGQSPERQLLEQIRALHQLTDRMLQARNEVKAKTITHAEKLTRTELRKKQADQLRQTREEFAARLAAEEAKHRSELATWIAAERMYLDVLLDRNLDKAAEMCWKVLDAQPPKIGENPDDAAVVRAELDALLRNRYLMTLMDLTARKSAPPELVRRSLEYLDQNIARELKAESENQQWKLLKFSLLVALDKPKDLEKALDDWIKAGDADNRWRVAQGYLLAEEGNLKDAISRFEAVAAADELGPGEWRTLADWYQAVNRRKDYERAKVEIYKTAEESRLNQWINGQIQPWLNNQGQLPSHLDDEVVLAFRACCRNRPIRNNTSAISYANCTRRAATSGCCRAWPRAFRATLPGRSILTCNRPAASSTKSTKRPRSIRWSNNSSNYARKRPRTLIAARSICWRQ